MFIELTDHLRCTADHAEQYLVLLPLTMTARRVEAGTLGCPVCGVEVMVEGGVADFGGPPPPEAPTVLTAPGVVAFLGLAGPGGYLALFGGAGRIAGELAELMPGVRLVLVNPPAGVPVPEVASVLNGQRSPIKARSMRGAVLGADHGTESEWVAAGVQSVLPGNRVVVEGPVVAIEAVDVVGEAAGVWVGQLGPPRR